MALPIGCITCNHRVEFLWPEDAPSIVLPYNTIFIGGAITQELRINLNRYLAAGTNARMVSTPKDAIC
ncbi:MAG: hypothetical protein EBQ70_02010 [Betaproteobacteria bacterium]|nr:hypothetical protein [Betaproteobacteria bacterium]